MKSTPTDRSFLTRFAWLSIAAAIITIALKAIAYLLTGSVGLLSDALEQGFKFRVSASGLRSVEHVGGLDNWLLKTSDEKLSTNARKVKKAVSKKQAVAA